MTSFDIVCEHLSSGGILYALIGGVALAARGAGRSTLDIDLLTTDSAVLKEDFWAGLREQGFAIEVRKGDWDDPLGGVVRIDAEESIDIVVGKYKWERDVVQRAEQVAIRGTEIRVPKLADLILLKLAAGGPRDLLDAAALLTVGGRESVAEQLAAVMPTLPEEMQRRLTEFLQNSSSMG